MVDLDQNLLNEIHLRGEKKIPNSKSNTSRKENVFQSEVQDYKITMCCHFQRISWPQHWFSKHFNCVFAIELTRTCNCLSFSSLFTLLNFSCKLKRILHMNRKQKFLNFELNYRLFYLLLFLNSTQSTWIYQTYRSFVCIHFNKAIHNF